eukprot:CAMPEP_0119161340 /NCGR_PEP_ID=MMETSP1315-20130426/1268_1 /TAXON_ID=676789 /ORGANISM="Prasinoderma singularis, Strain RCC927" /LENGTH=81 /DNA_ID=CAMNT_0007154073 /DNA_START=45 /DNA_END=287 /DNA_ORIENTATION=+
MRLGQMSLSSHACRPALNVALSAVYRGQHTSSTGRRHYVLDPMLYDAQLKSECAQGATVTAPAISGAEEKWPTSVLPSTSS